MDDSHCDTLVSQLIFVDIKMEKEYKCINLLFSLSESWDNLIVAIGSTPQSTLNFKDVFSSFLLDEMRIKSMEGVDKDVLSIRGHPQERKNKYLRGIYKSRGISKYPRQKK
jgi:hypothetical protein